MYPKMIIDKKKFENNIALVREALNKAGISFTFVTKCFCALPDLTNIAKKYADHLGDTRAMNLERLGTDKPRVLLRLPMPGEAHSVVRFADMSLNSELETVRALDAAAGALSRAHRIILMFDLGDLREGYFSADEMLADAAVMAKLPNIRIVGVGVNLSCYGGVVPELSHMNRMVGLAGELSGVLGYDLEIVSGGGSSSLKFVFDNSMPRGITNLRIGEAVLTGLDPATGAPYPGLHRDVFTFEAEVIEIKEKPSVPSGQVGLNAFGEKPTIEDRGIRRRAILAAGRQDVDPDGLTPINDAHIVIGASSDHLLIDVHDDKTLRVGQTISFTCSYSAILRAFTGPYVGKE